ncbi:GldG family protein [Pseudoflavonifractor sp. MSJ-37]|uniref:GldG family protein n=1 Tax=Pseudoflavonifractor sp. MSJ-37 TaxID=2841531 RepID=UPI001C111019|nr:GldG family protein [Pseudoflavonifractor sp. MSJ-37]MBU5434633.1 GldG family protein [Pseudoflavonifractor sp. MSJ-37]
MKRKNETKRDTGALRRGGYLAGVTAAAVAIVILVDLIVGQLPSHLREFDLTDNSLYQVSDTSKEFLAGLDKDVEIVVLAEDGATDERILKFLDHYAALSDRLSVKEVDPVAHPNEASAYDASTDALVVICDDTGKQETIPYSEIITYTYDMFSSSEDSFDADGQLTSAISAVTGDVSKKIYTVSGHGESSLSAAIRDAIDKSNFDVEDLTLLLSGAVPEDCDLLLVNGPTSDLSADESAMLSDYLSGGGQMVFLCADSEADLPNWTALLSDWGLELQDGYIADTERYYPQFGSPFAIAGEIMSGSDVTSGLSSDSLTLLTNSRGFLVSEDTDADVSAFLSTSASGYAVTTDGQQIQGTYVLGAVSQKTGEDGVTGRLTVLGSASLIDGDVLASYPSLVNQSLFVKVLTAGFDDITDLSIPAKSLSVTYNTISSPGLWSTLYLLILPVGILILGFVVWTKRRKR